MENSPKSYQIQTYAAKYGTKRYVKLRQSVHQGVEKQRAKYCTKHKAKFKVTLMFADKYWQQSNPDIIYVMYRNITRYYRQNTWVAEMDWDTCTYEDKLLYRERFLTYLL